MSEHQKSPSSPKLSAVLEADYQILHRRNRLLEASANATSVLLTVENFDEAIDTALQIIVEGAGCDRINVLEGNFDPLSDRSSSVPTYHTAIYEWTRPGIMRQMDSLETGRIPSAGIEAFLERYYLHGDGFGGLLADWVEPLRSFYAAVRVQSSYSVPIRVKGQWWGVLCLNYCRAAIEIGAAEVAVLRSIADCIGSAIQRDRTQKIILQAEQVRVAELAKANHLLKQTVDLLATEPDLNRFLDYVLKAFSEQFDAPLIQYWESPEPGDIAYLRLACRNGQILTAADLPNDCLVTGVPILPELAGYGNFQTRQRYYVIEDIPTDPIELALFSPLNFDLETWCTEHGIRKMINIALMWSEKATSSLILYFPSDRHLSDRQIELMCALAQQVTLAIQLTQLAEIKQSEAIARAQEQAAHESVTELVKANTALKQSLDTLATDPDLDRFIGYTLKLIAEQLDAPRIEYWVHSDREDRAYSYLTYCQGQTLKSSDPSAQVGLDVTPFLDIPLKVGNTNIGTLTIYLSSYRTFPGQTIELAHALAQQLTFAIELTRFAEEAQQAALLQERTRMAREIHDTLAQAFGGISMQLQAFDYFAATQPEKAQTHLLTAQALARDGLAEARRSVWTLYLETSEYEDPARTIAKFIEQAMSRQSVPIDLAIDGSPRRLHPDLGLNLLRIAQESIANALRHAQPQTIQIRLSYSLQNLQMTIRDDGCGFEAQSPSPGFGLMGMQQRAARIGATWHLVSQIDRGTSITVTLAHPETP
ncbi:MAG: GAF domain-containing sensor histidine kinase [Microcoleus sp. PH2017_01_SCD_O_A]|uniref:GAF domain-containing sensor histidine kinase n=1 Tax=Microcoleus sp. PH2017_01_SCD_O_A TaxID=2798812 RepID=UPI001D84682C|nr:GAF domain-containing sensor histidine kinase [Microcoleus sp. PH2017_01_SCD_O_A]MCC3420050.1 GAF domain-containing sensor histidine kinase [Microcoleus sp. PH2017_07_MST_O_A]MCC3429413.1 GAF domain-containing sensor histidine kinase [Microcoleus sp. PH2017_04_SCI_O_A]MCC3511620.1 GAF domain-containing sensor histidine kinase [Microcoleus sp. PH2017_17_BER_D_A]TAG66752.1 MAG: GAF domain-containing protein [Oscillatoriales cyanobacterium]MCC3427367.1 GAF domain-containing sensor histidine ki